MRSHYVLVVLAMTLLACGGPSTRVPVQNTEEVVRDILEDSIDRGLNRLGQPDGFSRNQSVRIELPEELHRAEKLLRRVGMEKLLDELQFSLNRTAEAIIPSVKTMLRQTAGSCFVPDPALLSATPGAITRRFRANCDDVLLVNLKPMVTDALRTHHAAAGSRRFQKRLASLDRRRDIASLDLEGWMTRSLLDGIYVVLEEEERILRRSIM